MAKLPPKKSEENTGEWLNTYADMVTLLLTFFVLLFACSNLDETKLQYVFQEFKSRGKYVNQYVAPQDPTAVSSGGIAEDPNSPGGEGTMPQSFEELYVYLAEYIENNNLSDSIAVEQGASHMKISIDGSVLFDGDSSYLKSEAREILDTMSIWMRAIKHTISRNTVSGHTSVGSSIVNDWNLSALRAAAVVNYLEGKNTLEGSKFRVMGCGSYEPVGDDPAKNRRVEMLLLKNELDITDINVIMDILKHDYGVGSAITDPENQKPQNTTNLPPGSVDKIISVIKEKFEHSGVTTVGKYGPTAVDGNKFIPVDDTSGGSAADKKNDTSS